MKQKNEEVENGKTRVKYKNLETPVHYSTRVHKVLSYFQLLQQWFCYWSVPMAAERPDHLCRWLWGDAWHHSCLQRLTSRPDPTRPDLIWGAEDTHTRYHGNGLPRTLRSEDVGEDEGKKSGGEWRRSRDQGQNFKHILSRTHDSNRQTVTSSVS